MEQLIWEKCEKSETIKNATLRERNCRHPHIDVLTEVLARWGIAIVPREPEMGWARRMRRY